MKAWRCRKWAGPRCALYATNGRFDDSRRRSRGSEKRPSGEATALPPTTEDQAREDRLASARAWSRPDHGGRRRRSVRYRDVLAGRGGVRLRSALDGAREPAADVGDPVDVRPDWHRGAERSRRRAARALSPLAPLARLLPA